MQVTALILRMGRDEQKQSKKQASVQEKGAMVDLTWFFFVHGTDHARRVEDESDSVGTCKDTSSR